MTRLKRFVCRWLERLIGIWKEGPEPPRRLAEEVRLYRHHYPNATAADWELFAKQFAARVYRMAFIRGFEWNERCWPDLVIDPEAVSAHFGADSSLGDNNPMVRRLLTTEPPRGMTAEQLRLIDELSRSPFPIHFEVQKEDES